jgi:DNA-binding MarR family transcriptional regulator
VRKSGDGTRPEVLGLADKLHSSAIHLLRRLRVEDESSGLTAPRLSALSVIVFAGPVTVSELAAAEQVRPPTVSRLVKELEREGLVERSRDPGDERVQRVSATPKGRKLLLEGRKRRVRRLAEDLARLAPGERKLLLEAAEILERLTLPKDHPIGPGGR